MYLISLSCDELWSLLMTCNMPTVSIVQVGDFLIGEYFHILREPVDCRFNMQVISK